MKRIFVGFSLLLTLMACAPQAQPTPYPTPAETALGRWQQDLEYLKTNFSTLHTNPWVRVPKERFEQNLAALEVELGQLSDAQIQVRLVKIMAEFRDLHVRLFTQPEQFMFTPVQMRWFGNDLYVVNTNKDLSGLVGAKLESLNGFSAQALGQALEPYTFFENRYGFLSESPNRMFQLGFLGAAGVVSPNQPIKLEASKNGVKQMAELPAVKNTELGFINPITSASNAPLYLQNTDKRFWHTYLKSNTAYFKYNNCNDPDGTLSSSINAFLQSISSNPTERIVLDLRGNGGGNSALLRPLISALGNNPITTAKKLFVVSDRDTASSGFRNVMELKAIGAVHVGEASRQRPYYTGNVRQFFLPNSKLEVQYSTQITALDSADVAAIEPSEVIVPTPEQFFALQDPVLNALEKR